MRSRVVVKMELVSRTSLRTAQLIWRPGHGGFAFTVVCKATFALRPDLSPLAPSQEPVVEADVLADGGGSIAVASDLVPLKKRPEVILVGQAFAPGGKRAPSFVARLVVGELDKALQIAGNRGWGADGQLGEPAPFTRMPLVWERAAGGPGTVNPVGRSFGARRGDGCRGACAGAEPAPGGVPARVARGCGAECGVRACRALLAFAGGVPSGACGDLGRGALARAGAAAGHRSRVLQRGAAGSAARAALR